MLDRLLKPNPVYLSDLEVGDIVKFTGQRDTSSYRRIVELPNWYDPKNWVYPTFLCRKIYWLREAWKDNKVNQEYYWKEDEYLSKNKWDKIQGLFYGVQGSRKIVKQKIEKYIPVRLRGVINEFDGFFDLNSSTEFDSYVLAVPEASGKFDIREFSTEHEARKHYEYMFENKKWFKLI